MNDLESAKTELKHAIQLFMRNKLMIPSKIILSRDSYDKLETFLDIKHKNGLLYSNAYGITVEIGEQLSVS